jgi:hypothetical protein
MSNEPSKDQRRPLRANRRNCNIFRYHAMSRLPCLTGISFGQHKPLWNIDSPTKFSVTGALGFLWLASMRSIDRRMAKMSFVWTFSSPVTNASLDQLAGNKRFELLRHDVKRFRSMWKFERILQSGPVRRRRSHYQFDPVPTTKTSRARPRINMLRACETPARTHTAGLDERSIWRPGGRHPLRRILGPVCIR